MVTVYNPQFPHACEISRMTLNDSVYPPTETAVVVLTSICQNQINSGGGTSAVSGMYVSDYTCFIPLQYDINGNEVVTFIDVDDAIKVVDKSRVIIGRIKQTEPGNLGIRVWYNQDTKPTQK